MLNAKKNQLEKEYSIAKKMGCGDGFYSNHFQELIKYNIK